jgi:hypothetical protein
VKTPALFDLTARVAVVLSTHVSAEISKVCRKAGIHNDLATLRVWALQWGFDEALGPETPEERARPGKPMPRYQRIRLGRIRRAGS